MVCLLLANRVVVVNNVVTDTATGQCVISYHMSTCTLNVCTYIIICLYGPTVFSIACAYVYMSGTC